MILVQNAIKFTLNGFVTVSASIDSDLADDWLCVSVKDSGVGIDEKDL